jgi:Uma2 family endonuclease
LLVVEILSPSTAAVDRGQKQQLCQVAGVDYWIVEPGNPWGRIERFGHGGSQIELPSR